MRIILYFGSFNPLHNGHMNAAINAVKAIGAYKLIFIPNYESFSQKDNDSCFVNPVDRYNMIKEAIKDIKFFDVSEYEINQQRKVYTIETLQYFANKYYRDNIYILMGYDQLNDFYHWKEWKTILKIASIIAFKREGININKALFPQTDFLFIENNANNISSSWIRKNKLVNFLPKQVLNYINNHGLYLDSRLLSFLSAKRFKHSLRVAIMCYEIMQIYDPKNALNGWVAGAYHDICKEFGENETVKLMDKYNIDSRRSWKVMHGPIAKEFLREIFSFNNDLVLNAIANHTIPDLNSKLTVLDKVLFCCDKLEPYRTNEDVKNIEHYRSLLKKDLDKCFDELYEYQKNFFENKKRKNLENNSQNDDKKSIEKEDKFSKLDKNN